MQESSEQAPVALTPEQLDAMVAEIKAIFEGRVPPTPEERERARQILAQSQTSTSPPRARIRVGLPEGDRAAPTPPSGPAPTEP